ncbi:hypothetical protein ACUN7V_06695 [Quadrisphaera oryzae]|uniref:hypothetical protein n=1 Tax=Quadrisphaera TaxID=317661 RepID=UPI0016461865|nr:hypothetical protein [Quadrisphaera sp. RL12-1S]MBC3761501.1 hypothetical protein [Quadrisphaera sp. RL12-1S]
MATVQQRRRRPPPPPPRRRAGGGHRVLGRLVGTAAVLAVLAGGAWVAVQQVAPSSTVVVERCTAVSGDAATPYDLAPDQAANAALITAVVQQRGMPPRAATIALATAVQESKLRNITYGDRDSLGLFQQRPSQGWGTAAQIQDPVYATNAFLDVLQKVDGYADAPITEVAQRVQRSAFPDAYADHEPEGRAYASALTGYSPAALTCRLRPATDSSAETAAANGYWPRTQPLVDALARERGTGVPVAPTDEGAGAVIGTPVAAGATPDDAQRRAGWSAAQWAVAHAADAQVVAVGTDGRQWRRDRPDDGWVDVPQADRARLAPAGAAVVLVAGGRAE